MSRGVRHAYNAHASSEIDRQSGFSNVGSRNFLRSFWIGDKVNDVSALLVRGQQVATHRKQRGCAEIRGEYDVLEWGLASYVQ